MRGFFNIRKNLSSLTYKLSCIFMDVLKTMNVRLVIFEYEKELLAKVEKMLKLLISGGKC